MTQTQRWGSISRRWRQRTEWQVYKPRNAGSRAGQGWTPPQPPEGASAAHSGVSDFWPLGLGERTSLLSEAPQFVAISDGPSRTLVGFVFFHRCPCQEGRAACPEPGQEGRPAPGDTASCELWEHSHHRAGATLKSHGPPRAGRAAPRRDGIRLGRATGTQHHHGGDTTHPSLCCCFPHSPSSVPAPLEGHQAPWTFAPP